MFSISAVPCFDDNYIWVLQHGCEAIAVDPGDAVALQAWLDTRALTLSAILITHRHHDHIGGLAALTARQPLPVYGPAGLAGITHPLCGGEVLTLCDQEIEVLATPGHTREHLSYLLDGALFCGDTLFGAGCGRVFDGEPVQLFASLHTLAALPPDTRVYCAHEYTLSNLRFAAAVEPDNVQIRERIAATTQLRAANHASVPSTIGMELATNPFLRCHLAEVGEAAKLQGADSTAPEAVFIALRNWKNHFK